MYSFRKDFGDRREEAVKEINGYKELSAFLERASNLSQGCQTPSDFICQCEVTLTIIKKAKERLKANWKALHDNGETISHTEDFLYNSEFSDFAKIIIYILRKDNLEFKVLKDSKNSNSSIFAVKFKI